MTKGRHNDCAEKVVERASKVVEKHLEVVENASEVVENNRQVVENVVLVVDKIWRSGDVPLPQPELERQPEQHVPTQAKGLNSICSMFRFISAILSFSSCFGFAAHASPDDKQPQEM